MVARGWHEFSLEILQLFLNAPCRRSFIREMRENQNEEQKKDSQFVRQHDDSHRQTRPIFARCFVYGSCTRRKFAYMLLV